MKTMNSPSGELNALFKSGWFAVQTGEMKMISLHPSEKKNTGAVNDRFSIQPSKTFSKHPDDKRKYCHETGKRSFISEKSARKKMRQIQVSPGANHYKVPRKVYQCGFCNTWHLTSQQHERRAG